MMAVVSPPSPMPHDAKHILDLDFVTHSLAFRRPLTICTQSCPSFFVIRVPLRAMQRETAIDAPWRTMRPLTTLPFWTCRRQEELEVVAGQEKKVRDGRLTEMRTRNMISGEKSTRGMTNGLDTFYGCCMFYKRVSVARIVGIV